MISKGLISKKTVFLILAILLIVLTFVVVSHVLSADSEQPAGQPSEQQPSEQIPDQAPVVTEGYRAVYYDDYGYIAVGTGGRIDRIDSNKKITNFTSGTTVCLNGVASLSGINVVVGDDGVILVSKDGGAFKLAQSNTTKPLNAVTVFQGAFVVAGDEGTLIYSSDGEQWTSMDSGIKNNIISISSNDKMCMAVTRESLVLMSNDGLMWDLLDYNKFYEGLSKPCRFRSIRANEGLFFIAGEYLESPGTPAILSTDTGDIWREHVPIEINDKPSEEFYPITANVIAVDTDQIIVACNDGKLLTVTECVVCNKLDVLSSHSINDIISINDVLALAGDNFWFDIFGSDTIRQYDIAADQALNDYNNGAYIVDVRTDEEYAQLHIKGCIHIPLNQVEAELEKVIPDKSSEIIFYCSMGGRSQQALEKALLMGYQKVYNLGKISDWPYETETGINPRKE